LLVFGMNRPRIDSTLPALVARVQPTRALERKKMCWCETWFGIP